MNEDQMSWQFPAGEIEPGESAEAAAVREAGEETGLMVRSVQRLGERIHPATGRRMVYVVCRVLKGTAYVADEVELAEVAWCNRTKLVKYVPYPFYGPVQGYFDLHLDD